MYIQKLYINQSLLRGLTSSQLIIDRTQVVEVTDKKIIIKASTDKVKVGQAVPASAS